MKSKKTVFLVIINLFVIGIICSFVTGKGNIISGKQIIKDMSETEYESQITQLNKSHEDYANTVNEYKFKIAEAITNQKVDTVETATADEVVTNIGEILKARTSDATATAEDIAIDKTAYVNGELINGAAIISSGLKLIDVVSSIKAADSNNYTTYTYTATQKCYVVATAFSSGQQSHGNDIASTGEVIREKTNISFTPYGKAAIKNGMWLLDVGETVTASYKGYDYGGGGTIMYIFEA